MYSDGVDHEKSGRFDDAIRCYKTAFFIEPEIDHKLNRMEKLGQNVKLKNEGTGVIFINHISFIKNMYVRIINLLSDSFIFKFIFDCGKDPFIYTRI